MAVAVTNPSTVPQDDVFGRHRVTIVRVQFDSSYSSPGGEAWDPASVGRGLGDPVFVSAQVESSTSLGYVVHYDYTNKKLIVFRQTNPAAAGGADVPLIEVANAVDLSGLFVRVLVIWSGP